MKRKLLFAMLCIVGVLGFNVYAQEAGTYYIQNVGNGKWLGPGNSWGTQASVLNHADYWKAVKISDGVYTLESVVSNGGTNYYLSGTYCDGGATNFTLSPVAGKENVYTIANASGGYLTTNGTTVDVSATDGSAEVSQWKLWSEADMAAGMAAATIANPFDATYLIKDHDLGRNNRDYSEWSNTRATAPKTSDKDVTGTSRYSIEAYHGTFDVNQTLSGIPNGTYAIRVNGFYRQDGSDANLPYVYAGDSKTTLPARTGSENSMQTAAVSFEAGNYLSEPAYVQVTDGKLKIGVATTGESCWVIFKNFHLQYYGDVSVNEVVLYEYIQLYNAALASAQSYQDDDMFTDDKTALNTVVTNNTLDTSSATQEQLTTATANLNAAAAAAATAVSNYTTYTTAVTTIAGGSNVDLTSLIVNPSFETGDLTGWTTPTTGNDTGVKNNPKTEGQTYYMDHIAGDKIFNTWANSVKTLNLTQTIAVLPEGIYEVRGWVSGYADGATIDLDVNGNTVKLTPEAAGGKSYQIVNQFGIADKGSVVITVSNTGKGNTFFMADDFELIYVGSYPDLTAVTGKMSTDVADAQTVALSAYESSKTIDTYNAAQAAISAAEASKAAYAVAAQALADANALKDAHNFASSTAISTFAEAIAAVQTKYDNGTLTNEEGNAGGSLGTIATGWHAGNNTPAAVYMRDGFALGDFAADPALHVNTWSIEGATDGSNFSVPFYESWTGDANSLPESTVTGTLAVENGLYTVSALVRVRAKTDVTATDATGITMDINGGGEGEYIAQDVTEGTQVGESQFTIATYTAKGLVKDGNLTLNFNIADGANISWLAFKNVKYTKVRDLTTEEAAVVPADLAIDATSTVFKGKTATLTATSTTEGASINGFVNWTSDNTSVATVDANGVVTGVAYGTANITATSTLNALATATCAVTVTAPTYDQLENLDFAEGPVHNGSIITTAGDLSKPENSGAVANMQTVTGWTITENGDYRAAGVMQYNSDYGLGGTANKVPTEGPTGTNGYALAIEAVWSVSAQYTQNVLLPAGAYTITLPIYNLIKDQNMSKNLIGFIADNGNEYLATATNYTANTWTTETVSFVLNEDTYGKLSLGFTSSGQGNAKAPHLFIDKVQIDYEPLANASEIAALNTAIEAAEGYALGFDEGDYAPYKNVDGVTALAAAKALDTTNPIAQSDVTSATTALTSATWTANTEEVNAVYDGTFAAATNNGAPAGWTMSNNTIGNKGSETTHARVFVGDTRLSEFNTTNSALFIRFDGTYSDRGSLYYYGNATGYTMPLKAGVTYYAKADIKGWGSTGKNQRMNITGPAGFSAVSQDLTLSNKADTDDAEPQQFMIVFEATVDGNYVINFQTPGDDSQKHNAVISNVEVMRAASANMTIASGKYGTFVAPFDVAIPSGVTAKAVTGVEGTTLTMSDALDGTIPANTPVVVTSDAEVNKTFYGKDNSAGAETVTEGKLVGIYKPVTIPAGCYVLQTQDVQAFYKLATAATANTLNRAYLTISSSPVKAFFFNDEDADGINAVEATAEDGRAIYNLAGQRVKKAQKGLYIIGGKTVLVK